MSGTADPEAGAGPGGRFRLEQSLPMVLLVVAIGAVVTSGGE